MRRFIKLEFKERDYRNASPEERKEMERRIVGVLAPRVWGYLEEMDEFEANFLGDVLKYWGKRGFCNQEALQTNCQEHYLFYLQR